MLTKILSLFQPPQVSGSERRPTHCLGLDLLDERLVPTVVFNPHFHSATLGQPAETVAAGSTNDTLTSPAIQLIFAGSYWNTPTGSQDRTQMIAQTQFLVNSPYFSGLSQYTTDGVSAVKPTLGTHYTDPAGIPEGFRYSPRTRRADPVSRSRVTSKGRSATTASRTRRMA